MINLIFSKSIISKTFTTEVEAGHTIGYYIQSLTKVPYDNIVAFVDGKQVSRELFDEVVLVDDGVTLGIAVTPTAPVAAWYTAATAFEVFLAGVTIATSLYAGYMMYTMATPETNIPGEEKLNRISGARNGPRKYEPVPVILGKRRLAGDWAANPYTDTFNDEQYHNLLLNFGYGPLKLENFRIGDTAVSDYEGVTLYFPGDEADSIGFFTRETVKSFWASDIAQEGVQLKLDPGAPITRSSSGPADSLTYTLFYPGGLFQTYEKDGRKLYTNTLVQTRVKKNSDASFNYLCHYRDFSSATSTDEAWIGSGQLLRDSVTGTFYFVDVIEQQFVDENKRWGWVRLRTELRNLATASSVLIRPIHYNTSYSVLVRTVPASAVLYTDGANKAVIIDSSYSMASRLSDIFAVGISAKPFFKSGTFAPPLADRDETWDITLERKYPPDLTDDGAFSVTVSWESLTTKRVFNDGATFEKLIGGNRAPVKVNGQFIQRFHPVIVGVRIKATNQLSGMLDKFNCDVTSVVPADWSADWRLYPQSNTDPSSWYKPTTNPAEIYRWLLQGPFNANALGNNRIDLVGLEAWRDRCTAEGWEVSGLLNFDSTLMVELNNVAFAGRAEFGFVDGKYGVVEKIEKTLPVQMFSSKNSWGFATSRSYPEIVDGIKFEFEDEDQQYEKNEGVFYDPAIPAVNRIGKFQGIDLSYITNYDQAYRHARFLYYEQALRRELFSLSTDLEGLICSRGDLVRLNHDMIDVGLGAGRVTAAGALTFELDEKKELQSGLNYGIQFRNTATGTIAPVTTAKYLGSGEWEVVSGTSPTVDDFAIYGVLEKEAVDCIVVDIQYNEDNSCDLTLTNAANEIYTRDLEDLIPVYDSALTPRIEYKRPDPPIVKVPESSSDFLDGVMNIRVYGRGTQASPIKQFILQYRIAPLETPIGFFTTSGESGGWQDAGVISANESLFQITVDRESTYEFRARAIGENDLVSAWSTIVSFEVDLDPAPFVTDLQLTELYNTPPSPNASLSTIACVVTPPNDPSWDHAVIEYRLLGQPRWYVVGRIGTLYENRVNIVVPSDGETYEVQARSVSSFGTESYDGIIKEITVININGNLPPGVIDAIAPLLPVENLRVEGSDTGVTGYEIDPEDDDGAVGFGSSFTLGVSGGAAEFSGGTASLVWDDPNDQKLYFREYAIRVIDGNGDVLRVDSTKLKRYDYDITSNAEDFQRVNRVEGLNRTFTVEVRVIGRISTSNGYQQSPPAELTVTNPPPGLPEQLSIEPGFTVVRINFREPDDLDYKEMRVWLSSTAGFDVNDAGVKEVAKQRGGPVIISNLDTNSTSYARIATYDTFGMGVLSSEFEIETFSFDEAGFSAWAHVTQADRDFIDNNLENNAIASQKIINLTAAKITTGILAATSTITCEGQIEAITPGYYQTGGYRSTIGPRLLGPAGSEKVALLSYDYNGDPLFAAYEDGTVSITGQVTVTGGSGWGNFSDMPNRFQDNIPQEIIDNGGLIMTDLAMGYYNPDLEGFQTLIGNDGTFHFGGIPTPTGPASNFIDFDGTSLIIDTPNFKVNADGSVQISSSDVSQSTSWNDITNMPARFDDTTSTAGLYLTAGYMGYYNGTSFTSYIRNNGNFHFGSSTNYVDWNGTTLSLSGQFTTPNLTITTAGNLTSSGTMYFGSGTDFLKYTDGVVKTQNINVIGELLIGKEDAPIITLPSPLGFATSSLLDYRVKVGASLDEAFWRIYQLENDTTVDVDSYNAVGSYIATSFRSEQTINGTPMALSGMSGSWRIMGQSGQNSYTSGEGSVTDYYYIAIRVS